MVWLPMEVNFLSERLRDDCSHSSRATRRWGAACARRIALRLQQLAAAGVLEDMRHLPGRCHELDGDLAGCLSLDLDHRRRLIFKPAANPLPTKPDGGLNWEQVTEINILEIVDYHR